MVHKKICDECKKKEKEKRDEIIRNKRGLIISGRRMTAKDKYEKCKQGTQASKHYYRLQCQFNFNLSDYPNEFDFDLIRKYGWYKAKNHGNNLGGVSRDHMYSIMEGYRNGVDPRIISHPANCRLVRHSENISKLDGSVITLEQLIERIKKWDEKYGKSSIDN